MAPNCPEWYLSSWASIFAGGLSAGIYYTNSPDVVSYITNHASTDILVLENLQLLIKVLDGKSSILEALPDVKHVILIEGNEEEILQGKYIDTLIVSITDFQVISRKRKSKFQYRLPKYV